VALLGHSAVVTIVLVLNASLLVYALHKHHVPSRIGDLIGPDSGATCDDLRQYNRWLHFAINLLSTILLGSSSYCAQLLAAPTRKDVDKAHQNKTWFDIGVQSIRNLRKIDKKRRILWFCLMISSGMLHFM
jgi:hypothetical protein